METQAEVARLRARIQAALIHLPNVGGAYLIGEEELAIRVKRARAALRGEKAF